MGVTHTKRMRSALLGLLLLWICVFAGGTTSGQVAQKQSDQLLLEIMDVHQQLATNEVFLAQANLVAAYLQAAQQSDEAMKVQIYQRVQRLLSRIQRAAQSGSEKTASPSSGGVEPTDRRERARITAARTQIAQLGVALEAFELDVGRLPTTAEGLRALLEKPASNVTGWQGPYVREVPNDPWGGTYGYRQPGQGTEKRYNLYSAGPDRREGSADDITN